ncbi:MAG: phage holin family protein [Propionibacteriaceae bacterium]|jgi:uncharacterized membrane protein|nr:phage holin family protein [Propionibacteriaceae bacterium]
MFGHDETKASSERSDVAQLVSSITGDVRQIIQGEVALAQAELRVLGRRLALDGALLGLIVGLVAVSAIVVAGLVAVGFSWLLGATTSLSPWACGFLGCLIALVLFLVIIGVTAVVLVKRLKGDSAELKTAIGRISDTTKEAFGALQEGVTQGQELVESQSRRD